MLVASQAIPGIFHGAREYKDDSDALEQAQRTFNERGLYEAIRSYASDWYATAGRPPRVLDLCSATGLCSLEVAQAIPVESVTLVDTDQVALEKGSRQYFSDLCPAATCCTDAVTFKDNNHYDLILMNSAYHHIEDNRKHLFLQNAAATLSGNGQILLGEHFLPPYRNRTEFRASVVGFYTELVRELKHRQEPDAAINVIRRSGLYCWQGYYEYKVAWAIFLSHIRSASLEIVDSTEVWTASSTGKGTGRSGSAAVCLQMRP